MIRQMVGITDHVSSEASPDTTAVDHQTVRMTEEIFALLPYANFYFLFQDKSFDKSGQMTVT